MLGAGWQGRDLNDPGRYSFIRFLPWVRPSKHQDYHGPCAQALPGYQEGDSQLEDHKEPGSSSGRGRGQGMHQQSSEGQERGAELNREGRGGPRKEDEEGWVLTAASLLTWKGLWPHEEGITAPSTCCLSSPPALPQAPTLETRDKESYPCNKWADLPVT